jgi:hypothetical protein
MDFAFLDRLFPSPGSVYPGSRQTVQLEQTLTIGGAPIVDCLSAMMQLMRSQQRAIEELQGQIEHQSTDQIHRISRLEQYVSHLTIDVKLDERPVAAYGQAPMPTMGDAVRTIEYRLTQLENKRRQTLLGQVVRIADDARRRDAFQQWSLVARAKGMLRDLCVGQAKRTRHRYLQKWMRYVALSKADQVNKRRIRALNYLSSKNVVQRFYDKWRRFIEVSQEMKVRSRLEMAIKVEGMTSVSNRSLARRYFSKMVLFVGECRTMQYRVKYILSMEQQQSRGMALKYLQKWLAYHKLLQLLRSRTAVVNVQSSRVFRALAQRYFENWKLCSQRRILRRQTRSVVPRLHHAHLVLLARRYFGKLESFARLNAERREKEAMQLALQQLARRCDALGLQLDLGLQTLSHTNGVLSKVLEHVSFNSSWERKHSSHSPARGDESQANQTRYADPSATSADAVEASLRGAENWAGSSNLDAWVAGAGNPVAASSAEDLLLQLRSRLQRVNQQPSN